MGFFDNDLFHPGRWGNDMDNAFNMGSGDPSNPYRDGASGLAGQAGQFGNQAAQNYGNDTGQLDAQRTYLQQQANGQHSVSAEQLRQGLQQNLAAQQAQAASANPNNSAMAARTAAITSGQLGYGMAGQQATAGLAERNQANQALSNLNLGMRGQDMQGALGGYGAGIQGYGTALGTPQANWGKTIMGGIQGALGYAAMSDRRLKEEITDGEHDANHAIEGLRAYVFKYKGTKYGKGKQLGIMAQDLEKAGLGHAVIETPEGKAVHGAKLATSIAAMLPGLHKRISKLEGTDEG